MVRMDNLFENVGMLYSVFHCVAYQVIVDAPPQIPGAGVGAVSPPGVAVRIYAAMSESIGKAGIEEITYPFSLFG